LVVFISHWHILYQICDTYVDQTDTSTTAVDLKLDHSLRAITDSPVLFKVPQTLLRQVTKVHHTGCATVVYLNCLTLVVEGLDCIRDRTLQLEILTDTELSVPVDDARVAKDVLCRPSAINWSI
jgi:hypothetical protein